MPSNSGSRNLVSRRSIRVARRQRQMLERRDAIGAMLQLDGIFHQWLEDRCPACCLFAAIDMYRNNHELKFKHLSVKSKPQSQLHPPTLLSHPWRFKIVGNQRDFFRPQKKKQLALQSESPILPTQHFCHAITRSHFVLAVEDRAQTGSGGWVYPFA